MRYSTSYAARRARLANRPATKHPRVPLSLPASLRKKKSWRRLAVVRSRMRQFIAIFFLTPESRRGGPGNGARRLAGLRRG